MRAYFDATEDGEHRVFLLACAIADDDDWLVLERQWIERVPKGIKRGFHATDCAVGGGEFFGWELDKRQELFDDLLALLLGCPVYTTYGGFDLLKYRELELSLCLSGFAKNKYDFAFRDVFQSIGGSAWFHHPGIGPCDIICDRDGRQVGSVRSWLQKLASVKRKGKHIQNMPWLDFYNLGTWTEAGRSDQPLLQAVDLFAYLVEQRFAPKTGEHRVETVGKLDKFREIKHMIQPCFYTAEQLQRMYDHVTRT